MYLVATTANGSNAANTLFTYVAPTYAITTSASPVAGGTVTCTPTR